MLNGKMTTANKLSFGCCFLVPSANLPLGGVGTRRIQKSLTEEKDKKSHVNVGTN